MTFEIKIILGFPTPGFEDSKRTFTSIERKMADNCGVQIKI